MSRLVVGVDGSPGAAAALRWALDYAATDGRDVTVVSVVDPMIFTALWTATPSENTDDALVEAARVEAQRLVDDARATTDTDGAVTTVVRVVSGHPVQALVDAASEADLLVVGSRGAGGFSRLLLGSVSSGVVRHAHCSVAVVPRSA